MPTISGRYRLHVAMNREGALFVFFWIALGATAIYSGNSGIMLLFCALSATAVLLVMIAIRNFQPMTIQRRFNEDIYAGHSARVDLFVTNNGNTPIYGLHIFEKFDDAHFIGPVFFSKIAPGETATARYMCIFEARGLARFPSFEIRSRFPVPFLELRKQIDMPDAVCVFPRRDDGVELIQFTECPQSHARLTAQNTHTIREIRDGQRRGRILWKLSAKKDKLIEDLPFRQRSQIERHSIRLRMKSELPTPLYETQISQIATFCTQSAMQGKSGCVQIRKNLYPYGKNDGDLRKLLCALASFDAQDAQNSTPMVKPKDR